MCYISVFKYASTRAIHLELCAGMSIPAFNNEFKRFIHWKEVPAWVQNFQAFKFIEIAAFFKNFGITREAILERSPWLGGFYERLNQVIKPLLQKVVGNAKLKLDGLKTIFIEVENILNSRPLTYLSEKNYDVVITPYHMMYGRSILNINHSKQDLVTDVAVKYVQNHVKYPETVLNHV